VSAGDSHNIQLPHDSITLYAFVLDDNSDGMLHVMFTCILRLKFIACPVDRINLCNF